MTPILMEMATNSRPSSAAEAPPTMTAKVSHDSTVYSGDVP